MARRPKSPVFKTNRQKKNNGKFMLILVASVALVLSLSLIYILVQNGGNLMGAAGIDIQTETQTQSDEIKTDIEGSRTYLFWCADDSELEFAWLVKFELPERKTSVCALDVSEKPTDGGDKAESPEQIFAKYGKKELVNRIEKTYGLKIDGYIGSTPEKLKVMVNYFGGIDVTVDEQIKYRNEDFSLVLTKGKHNLKGDSFYKYIRYLGISGEDGIRHQSTVLNEIFAKVFVEKNADRGTNIFSKISNTLDTDLTIVDYSAVEQAAIFFAENGIAIRSICDTPDELK